MKKYLFALVLVVLSNQLFAMEKWPERTSNDSDEINSDDDDETTMRKMFKDEKLFKLMLDVEKKKASDVLGDNTESLSALLSNPEVQAELARNPELAAMMPMLQMLQQNPGLLNTTQTNESGQLSDSPQAGMLLMAQMFLAQPQFFIGQMFPGYTIPVEYYALLTFMCLTLGTFTFHSIMGNQGFVGLFILALYIITHFKDQVAPSAHKQ